MTHVDLGSGVVLDCIPDLCPLSYYVISLIFFTKANILELANSTDEDAALLVWVYTDCRAIVLLWSSLIFFIVYRIRLNAC